MELIASIPLIGPLIFWVVPFLVVLSIVVFIHELGHLMVGRWCGIKAEVFSVGFGKVLLQRTDRHGTQWQVAALPFGGYVKFLGDMDPSSAGHVDDTEIRPEDRKRAFHNASVGRRALTVIAGPMANFILSVVIFFGLAMYIGKASPEPVIGGIGELAPAEIGFQAGDRVLRIGDVAIEDFGQIIDALAKAHGQAQDARIVRDGAQMTIETVFSQRPMITDAQTDGAALAAGLTPGDILVKIGDTEIVTVADVSAAVADLPLNTEIIVTIERDDRVREIAVTPDVRELAHPVTGEISPIPFLGISMSRARGIEPSTEPIGVLEAGEHAVGRVWKIVSDTVTYIQRMLFDGATTQHLSGPLGIAKHSTQAAEAGLVYYIQFIAFVSTAIGFLNLLPIPVLDGGHLVFYAVEAIRRRPTNAKVVQVGSMVGLSLLLLLMVFVTFSNDLGLREWFSQG
ncbi:MAG: RIP metalloprotease RseP [Pseudomonadota bacterium]